jgi:hypothetical protein
MSPGRRSRPTQGPAPRSCDGDASLSMPASTPCCGELGLDDIAECSRRHIYCGPDSCAFRALHRRQLERHALDEWRLAELTVAADYFGDRGHYLGAWVAAQLRDLRDLLVREAAA